VAARDPAGSRGRHEIDLDRLRAGQAASRTPAHDVDAVALVHRAITPRARVHGSIGRNQETARARGGKAACSWFLCTRANNAAGTSRVPA